MTSIRFQRFLLSSLGYDGIHCANNIDDCSADPCENGGTCSDGVNAFECACATGWKGVVCADDVDECAESHGEDVCNVKGLNSTNICENGNGNYSCSCFEPWGGDG